jgi:Fic family protein
MAAKASAKSSKKDPVIAPAVNSGIASRAKGSKRKLAVAAAVEPPPKQLTLEERWASLEERLAKADPEFQRAYQESLDMSWIYHDSALEGSVYTPIELRSAVDQPDPASPTFPVGTDSSIQPICEEIRRHREALEYVRDFASQARKKRMPVTIDVVKKIYLILHPEEGDIKTVKYRKDIPQHRLYFHEYAPPDKITYKVRQILDWINDPETRRTRSAVRIAARAHYDLLRVFPFTTDSGKVARLFMNLLLLKNGFPPAIVHSTERQRYYEALKGASAVMTQIVHESIENNLASVEKLLEAHESKGYAVKV